MNRILVLVAIMVGITVLILWVAGDAWNSLSQGQSVSLTTNLIFIALIVTSLVLNWRGSFSQAIRYALMWLALFCALILAYSYKNDANGAWQRIAGEINPAKPVVRSKDEVSLRRSADGHFYVDVDINGTSMRMLADTGASTIALSVADAENAGIDVDQLEFNRRVATANGVVPAAAVTLDEVRVGNIVRNDIQATVTRGLSGSLLGMSFFNTLSKFEIADDELILRD